MMDPLLQMIIELREDLREMDKKLDEICSFYWRITGAGIAISFLVSAGFQIANLYMSK